jgi:hypothetical protein
MITTKLKAFFKFIEFLHSNIDRFNNYNDLINELEFLEIEKGKLKPQNNYKDKLKFDVLQLELDSKFKILTENTANFIKSKAKEMDFCHFDNEPIYSFNGIETEIYKLKENFNIEDLPEILKYKNQYIEYRTSTHKTYLSLSAFFNGLDEISKNLFDYFKDTEQNEFESFETKTFNSIEEALQVFSNKKQLDQRFWLTSFFEGHEQTKGVYKSLKSQIDNNGSFEVKEGNEIFKIYTPELATILISKELPANNLDLKTETIVNGFEYLETYFKAYKDGEQYFEKEFKVSPNTLYGTNAKHYVKDLHLNFFHVKHTGTNEGWGYVKKQYPFILTHKAIKEYGYYSGIVNKVDEQVKKYPKLFENFEICEESITVNDNDFIKGKITLKFIPQAESGYYEVEKEKEIRKYTIEKYFDLHLSNWEQCIDDLPNKNEKLLAISNAIFELQKDEYNNSHPEILRLINKNIEYFKIIEKYVDSNFRDEFKNQTILKQNTILSDLITHNNSEEIVKGIKVKYKNIQGKRLKLLFIAFKDLELLPNERLAKKFHECCNKEFDWNIASYNAMNGYTFNEVTDKDELNSMKQYLKTLLS